ncbi:MAG: aminotransferase class V-fold PLP-dependent enzyme [Butyricicoccus sp.]|nr:aminotransferase class V-fold PLP-dependent enzyme [Butyricicoccus sp.]
MIYLDNAATTLHKPDCVIEAVVHAMQTAGNAARGAHGTSLSAARTVYAARETLAAFFGCPRPDHVVFTQNATEALNIALCGLLHAGDHVITTDLEHNSVLRPLYRLARERGVALDFVPADARGRIDYDAFAPRIRPATKAIICTHASNLTGNLIDLARVSEIAHAHGLLFIVDASQTAGTVPIDMARMGIDVLCFTGHKGLLGPQGTGGLCIRPGVEIDPFKVGGSGVHSFDRAQPMDYPTRLEAGTLNSHGIAGLAAAVAWLQEIGPDAVREKEQLLMRRFYEGVSGIAGVTVYGDFSTGDRAAIVSLNIGDVDSAEIADILSEDYGIAIRAGAHCAPRMHEALGTAEQGAVRFSFSYFNTTEEIDAAVRAIRELAEEEEWNGN